MAITKDKKKDLLKQYISDLENAGSAYMINQNAVPVDVATKIRKEMKLTDSKMNVVRKRLFLKAVEKAGLEDVKLDDLQGSVIAIYSPKAEDFAPLKVINKYIKEFKEEEKTSSFGFLGGWFDKKWKGAEYVSELANVPSKEELLSKLLYLLKYPIQSFASTLEQIAKKK
jgi:large subunit ribosomal protein L10